MSRHILEKHSNIKFLKNPPSGSRIFPCERTDKQTEVHDEANGRFPQLCKRA